MGVVKEVLSFTGGYLVEGGDSLVLATFAVRARPR
jgi:hypothetical protein